MISPPSRTATARATADLPTAVGPAMRMADGLRGAEGKEGKEGKEGDGFTSANWLAGGASSSALLWPAFGWGRGGVGPLSRKQRQQRDSGANSAVGDVKGGEAKFTAAPAIEVKIDEVHHMPVNEPVQEVARDAAADEAEGKLPQQRVRIEVMPGKKQHQERGDGENGEQFDSHTLL